MSSGENQLVFNTRERAVSTDHNRAQAFIARDRSQLFRRQYNDLRQNFYKYPGVATQNVGGEIPIVADVYGGLMVDPQTTSVLVTPGELGCLFPDPSITADDSPYMLIDDPGVQTAGILTFTANVSGSIRIDLVECQPVSTILETDNRDIFNPSTGLFAPATVTKVQAFRLQYRIRTGTGGSGVPALVAGWLPLAAIVVPSGVADFNSCDFYDVRPLVEDRVRAQPAYIGGVYTPDGYSPVRDAEYFSQLASGKTTVLGYAESQFGGYVAGGWIRRSSPSFSGSFTGGGVDDGDPDFVTVSNAENQGIFAGSANAIVYLTAFFPAGLPRWVRYSHSAVGGGLGRVPKGPRGILLVTTQAPQSNGAMVPQNIGHGFVGSTPGVVLGTLKYNSGGTDFVPVNAQGAFHTNFDPGIVLTGTAALGIVNFPISAGTQCPANASELIVEIQLSYNNPGAAPDIATLVIDATNSAIGQRVFHQSVTIPVGAFTYTLTIRVPLIARPQPYTPGGPSTNIKIQSFAANALLVTTANAQQISVIGWRLGS